jgi:hypothetical protein
MSTDQDIGRAQALGRLAGRAGSPVTSCPYNPVTDPVLAVRWVLAYTGAGGRRGVETRWSKVRDGLAATVAGDRPAKKVSARTDAGDG